MNLDKLLEIVRKNHNAFRAIYHQEKAIHVSLLKQCCTRIGYSIISDIEGSHLSYRIRKMKVRIFPRATRQDDIYDYIEPLRKFQMLSSNIMGPKM